MAGSRSGTGSTIRHLLAHASGLSVDSDRVLSAPGRRRIYSNRGFEVLGDHLERRLGRPFATQLRDAVLEPLAMQATTLTGSPAHGARGPGQLRSGQMTQEKT